MIISYHGAGFFKVQFGNTVVAVNPISKDSKLKNTRFGADITLVSANHQDMNGVANTIFGDKNPFVIQTPGEYEVKETVIDGFASTTSYGGKKIANVIYLVYLEGMNLCFLGAHEGKDLPKQAQESIDNVDILFTPIGGNGVLDSAEAARLAAALEPNIIIPSFYDGVGVTKDSLKLFIKEAGDNGVSPIEKLTVKKKEVLEKKGEVILLSVS